MNACRNSIIGSSGSLYPVSQMYVADGQRNFISVSALGCWSPRMFPLEREVRMDSTSPSLTSHRKSRCGTMHESLAKTHRSERAERSDIYADGSAAAVSAAAQ